MSIRKKINGNFQVIATDGMTHITWSALKALRDGGKLIPGMFYRITDYVTTTAQENTQSAGHAFDVIVRADSANILNENATAALHSGDTYFAGQKLESWKLKYCLDNDSTRFAWADTTNGKGVIYQMIDERENDLPYDFKNIQFKRYKVTKYLVNDAKYVIGVTSINSQISNWPSLRWGLISIKSAEDANVAGSYWYSAAGESVSLQSSNLGDLRIKASSSYGLFILSDGTEKWFYTFSNFTSDSAEVTDASLLNSIYKNKFGYGSFNTYMGNSTLNLGNNILIGKNISSNTIGNEFNSNTIDNNFTNNTIGNKFSKNIIGNYFAQNTICNEFRLNVVCEYFSNNCIQCNFAVNMICQGFGGNQIGANFSTNIIGSEYSANNIGNNFNYNTVDNQFKYNIIGSYFSYNTVGNGSTCNTVGSSFDHNTVDSGFSYNTVGNQFNYNIVGKAFSRNMVGNGCNDNRIGEYCNSNTIGNVFVSSTIGNKFSSNTIGNACGSILIGAYYKFNHFEDGCRNLYFNVDGSSTSYVQKYRVLAGTALSASKPVGVSAGSTVPINIKLSVDGDDVDIGAA